MRSLTGPALLSTALWTLLRTIVWTMAFAASAQPAVAACKLTKLAELPVTMAGPRPLIDATINGTAARLILDSGAWWSTLSPAGAAQYNLRLRELPNGLTVGGIGGDVKASVTTVNHFGLTNIEIRHVDFLVGGTDFGVGAVGLLGQNVLETHDVEYDLANGVIRLMQPEGCGKTPLAYWSSPQQSISMMDIHWATPLEPHTTGTGWLNGARIQVEFDSGSPRSMLTRAAAARAGIRPEGAGVIDGGLEYGIGQGQVKSWIAPVASLKVGDEEIRNTRLRFADLYADWDMLLGMDFLLSHRIYVANSQRRLYFTYNGGPVFNLASTTHHAESPPPPEQSPVPASTPNPASDEPTDAAGFSRRGTAFLARHDLEHGIADLTRACELAPTEAAYFYQRGVALRQNRQPVLAMADFDQTLKLEPDHLDALIARAALRLAGRDTAGAGVDLTEAARIAPKEAEVRLTLGELFTDAGLYSTAVEQYDLWLPAHDEDARRYEALAKRCRARALGQMELKQALQDCNAAVRLNPLVTIGFYSRGLVWLRLGKFDQSIADFDQALKLNPKDPWALYGRGVDEARKGRAGDAQADFDAAARMYPRIEQWARNAGITP